MAESENHANNPYFRTEEQMKRILEIRARNQKRKQERWERENPYRFALINMAMPGKEVNGSIQLGSAESVEFLDRPDNTLCEIISDDGQYETDMFIMEKKSNGAWYGLKARTPNSRTGAGWPIYAAHAAWWDQMGPLQTQVHPG